MNNQIRNQIQTIACKAILSLNHQELEEVHASLIQILAVLDQVETIQDSVVKLERDSFQVFMQVG